MTGSRGRPSLVEPRAPSEEDGGRHPLVRPRQRTAVIFWVAVETALRVHPSSLAWRYKKPHADGQGPHGERSRSATLGQNTTSQCDVSLVSDSAESVGTRGRCGHGGDDDPPSQEIAHMVTPDQLGDQNTVWTYRLVA